MCVDLHARLLMYSPEVVLGLPSALGAAPGVRKYGTMAARRAPHGVGRMFKHCMMLALFDVMRPQLQGAIARLRPARFYVEGARGTHAERGATRLRSMQRALESHKGPPTMGLPRCRICFHALRRPESIGSRQQDILFGE